MTDDFKPSPSVDSYTIPMDARVPLLDDSGANPEDVSANTTTPKSIATNTDRPDSSLLPGKTPTTNFPQPPDSNVGQASNKKSKTSTASNKLFPVGELKKLVFYQALLSEFLGTLILTIVCTSTGLPITMKHVPDINGALASGFIVATIIVGFGYNSGAHINPAVTITFLIANEIDILQALFYIGMQLLGAVTASGLLYAVAPSYAQGNLGMTTVTPGVSMSQAFLVEFLITFILCYTVHAICDRRRDDIGGSKALAVGLAVTIGCLFGGPYTGGSMNPARSFGPATVMNNWTNHWIYWFGPMAGSIVAALIYKRVLRKPTSALARENSRLNIDKSNHI